MADVRIALLGPPAVERDGRTVTFDTRKATALLALLATTGREYSRERLAALLWPDADTTHARGSLRRTLSVTASAIGGILTVTRLTVALDLASARVDVVDFGKLRAAADPASLERAARLYRDDFLAGFSLRGCDEFEDWQEGEADRLRQQLASVLEQLVAARIASDEPARALDHARRWLSLDPLHEPAHQAVIRLLGWTGQRSAALRQYRTLVRVLDRELAVRPLPETTRLYDDVRAGRLAPPPAGQQVRAPGPPAQVAAAADRQAAASRQAAAGGRAAAVPRRPPGDRIWPLAGRAAELASLKDAWQAVGRVPGGQAVAVTGEAGCGKTRVLEEFRATLEAAGHPVLAARCHDGEDRLPFALSVDLLRAARSATTDLARRLPEHVIATVARLDPELAAAHPGLRAQPLSGPPALARLYSALGTVLLTALRRPGRTGLLLVEDVHWADGPSLDLLAYLVRRIADWPLLLVMSWRPEQPERLRVLRAALAEASAADRGRELTPGPLTTGEIAAVLRSAGLPTAGAGRMLAETRGLPLLVREYAEAMRSSGAPQDGQAWPPPASVRGMLSRRLLAASEPTIQVLSTAAVLGGGCDADVLREVSGRGEAETLEALDEATARFLLTETPPPGEGSAPTYDFPYEALRQVAYESATLARRRLLHGRAADALAARHERDPLTTRAAVIAGHLQRAGREAEAAQWWWRAAARSRELYAHAEAHAHLRQAVALGYPPVAGAVALGDELTVLGRYREALAEYETAAASSDGDDALAATIEHKLAEVHHRLGDWALAEAHLAAAADLLGRADLAGQARVAADRAVVAYRLGKSGEAGTLGREALAAAQRAADPAAVAQARNVLGMLAAREGDFPAAEEHLRESLAQARSLAEPGATVAALNNLARLLTETGRPAAAREYAEEALALGSELGDQHRVAALHTNLADLLHATGERDAAVGHLKEAARRFAAVDAGGGPRPEIWTLVEW